LLAAISLGALLPTTNASTVFNRQLDSRPSSHEILPASGALHLLMHIFELRWGEVLPTQKFTVVAQDFGRDVFQ
jgi:hypothetical protein